jgi:hypothetical protein
MKSIGAMNGMRILSIGDRNIRAQALELVFEDVGHRYYLRSLCSSQMAVELDDGSHLSIHQALKNGIVTVEELRRQGLKLISIDK